MNPCLENNKDADESVPSAYSLFCARSFRLRDLSLLCEAGPNLEWSWPLIVVLEILLVFLENKLVGNLSFFA